MKIECSETYTYDKSRRFPVEKGVRAAYLTALLPSGDIASRFESTIRHTITQAAISKAAEMWEKEWGPIPWDLVQILVTHVTIQVVVEFRVDPL